VNWDAIGAIGEMFGALAVVVTLAYLALQVRVSRSSAADTNRLNRVNGVREWALSVCNNEALLAAMAKAYKLEDYYEGYGRAFGVSEQDAARLDWMHHYFFWVHYGQFASTNDEKTTEELERLARTFYNLDAVNYSWEKSPFGRSFMDPKFASFIDAVADRASSTHAAPHKTLDAST